MSRNYDLKSESAAAMEAPVFAYEPPSPKGPAPKIALIGCGGITEHHLRAYHAAGWEVVALFDLHREAAEARKAEFYPEAKICAAVEEIFSDSAVGIVDIATHPKVREDLILRAADAGKHILSQKPFAVDLPTGRKLVEHARAAGVKMAVNQNGRWAPYFSYLRQAVKSGLIGEVGSAHLELVWDHTWTAGTPFEEIHHLMLYDFGIHWIDAARSFFGDSNVVSVSATVACFPGQSMKPPLLATTAFTFPEGLATIAFNGSTRFGARESCTIVGSKGTLRASGEICGANEIEVTTEQGCAVTRPTGSWFPDGFRGCMGELMCAIEEDREPENSAADNLKSLAVVLAAMQAADEGRTIRLGL